SRSGVRAAPREARRRSKRRAESYGRARSEGARPRSVSCRARQPKGVLEVYCAPDGRLRRFRGHGQEILQRVASLVQRVDRGGWDSRIDEMGLPVQLAGNDAE